MIGINEQPGKTNLAIKTGILQYAEKLGCVIVTNGLAKAIPLAGKLAAQGGWLSKLGVGCSKFLGSATKFMAGPLGPVVGEIVGQLVIYTATNAFSHVAKKLKLINEDDKVEEIGYRLEEANRHDDWRRCEDFATFSEYYGYLREQVPNEAIDQSRLKDENLYYTAIGGNALRQGVAEHYKLSIPVDMLVDIGRCRLDGETLKKILDRFSAENYKLNDFTDYLQGTLKGGAKTQIECALTDSFKDVYPEWSEEQVRAKLAELKTAFRDDDFIVQAAVKEQAECEDEVENG